MNRDRAIFIALNLIGGIAVLGSYVWGMGSRPDAGSLLWGGVPESLRTVYSVNMLLAAAGYFGFTPWFLFHAEPSGTRFFGDKGFGVINGLYALVLIPSALWLPLTFAMVDAPSTAIWWTTRLDLFAVGVGALGLLGAVWTAQPPGPKGWRAAAIVGLLPFCLQTAVLDALVWPWLYSV